MSSEVKGFSDDRLLWIVSEGIPKTTMVAFSGMLSETEIWQTLTYVRSLAK